MNQDPLSQLPGYILRRASNAALAALNRRLASFELRHADVAFLMLLEDSPGMTQSAAGRILEIQRANMVAFVGRLQARGLVERRPADGRSHALQLTQEGRRLLSKVRKVVQEFEAELLTRVPAKLRPMVLPVLMALWKAAG